MSLVLIGASWRVKHKLSVHSVECKLHKVWDLVWFVQHHIPNGLHYCLAYHRYSINIFWMTKLMFKSKDKMSRSAIYIVKEQGVCHVGGKRRGEEHGLMKKIKETKSTELRPKRPGSHWRDLWPWTGLFLPLKLNVLICKVGGLE